MTWGSESAFNENFVGNGLLTGPSEQDPLEAWYSDCSEETGSANPRPSNGSVAYGFACRDKALNQELLPEEAEAVAWRFKGKGEAEEMSEPRLTWAGRPVACVVLLVAGQMEGNRSCWSSSPAQLLYTSSLRRLASCCISVCAGRKASGRIALVTWTVLVCFLVTVASLRDVGCSFSFVSEF